MTIWVLVAVLGAACLHALWNALVRVGASRAGAMMVLSGVQGVIGLAVAASLPWPNATVWPWLLASGLVHSAYKIFLTFAYEQGDLSRVYPLARGTAPLVVLAISAAFLGETVRLTEGLGIVILGAGILSLARGVLANGEQLRLLPFAFGAALATAGYTLIDGLGARVAGDAWLFVAWVFILDGVIFALILTLLRGRSVIPAAPRVWVAGSLGAAASYASYAVAVWAMTVAPIALVAALRETSILFAVLIGWAALGERIGREKAVAVGLVALGVVLTRL